ncbi:hypothetical protein IFM89_010388 [Coptis chinensis]|uniref:Uncharacterized protein n=1 Tax=Coptis chinensis TaxID=261450 RepID=A0A835IY44_9MAGN|nr:hypothetical protein IFM89_010388 [Coptis chinensis]
MASNGLRVEYIRGGMVQAPSDTETQANIMECLVLPIVKWRRRSSMGSRLGYYPLLDDMDDSPVTVVVGKDKREFLVDPFVLDEDPFRILISMMRRERKGEHEFHEHVSKRVIFVDVDAILFEHMLWLMYNDCSSLFKLNLKEIIDFYAQDF